MSRLHAVLFVGAATIAAGTASAETRQWRTTSVELPDGSVADIQYLGDVPPKVTITMPVLQQSGAAQTFAIQTFADKSDEAEGAAAVAPAATRARRVVQPRAAPVAPYPAAPQFVVAGDMPSGSTYEYTLITTGTDGRVCTQRTEWRSRGPGKEPVVRRTDAGEGCAAANSGTAPAPVADTPISRPKIVPVDPDAI